MSRASIWFGVQIEEPIRPTLPADPGQPTSAQTAPIQLQPVMEQFVHERYLQEVTRRDFHQSGLLLQYAKERQTTPHMLWLSFMTHIQKYHLDNTLANLIEYLNVTAKQLEGKVTNYMHLNSVEHSHGYGAVGNANHGHVGTNSVLVSNQRFDNNASRHHSFETVNTSVANSQRGFDNHTSNYHEYANTSGGNHHIFDATNSGMSSHIFGSPNVVIARNATPINANSMTYGLNLSDNFNSSVEEAKVEFKPFVRPPPYTHADFLKVKREAEKAFEKKLEEEERKKAEEEKKKAVLRNINDMLK